MPPDPRFKTWDRDETCSQCGHPQKEHYNVFCRRDGCECLRRNPAGWNRFVTTKKRTPKTAISRKEKAKSVTTKQTYTRFQPHPRKYESAAAKQQAYRQRAKAASVTTNEDEEK